jgi:PilZ domain
MNQTSVNTVPHCSRAGCNALAELKLASEKLCLGHFVSNCYSRLDEIAEGVKHKRLNGPAPMADRNFLAECTRQVATAALRSEELNNQDRARLLHILLFANELISQLRRSERIARLVPVRLITRPHAAPWIEETVTQDLSKHGVMLRCTKPHNRGEMLEVVRLDTGRSAIARVVWRQYDKFSQYKVALEILNTPNFWNWRAETGSSQ